MGDQRGKIEQRHKKWMEDRAISKVQEATTKEMAISRPIAIPRRTIGTSDQDAYLDKLTTNLTAHIREEIRREFKGSLHRSDVRETVASKMESYLEAELSTHTCQICYELMTGPSHVPILLFPCGHTFCSSCVDKIFTAKPRNTPCSICSKAVNQSLKDLIDQFAAQKKKVETAKGGDLDDIFESANHKRSANEEEEMEHAMKEASRYMAKMKSCEARYAIMRNELQDIQLEEEILRNKLVKIRSASQHLMEERDKLDQKIQLLQEERLLIDKHLKNQEVKEEEVTGMRTSAQEKSQLIQKTLRNLQNEMDKLRLLSQGIREVK